MPISMYKASVPIFVQFLTSMSAVLDKASAFAEARKIDEGVLLSTRLYPDMFPLSRQLEQMTVHACRACAELSGTSAPAFESNNASFAALKARIGKAADFVKGIKPEQIDGTEDKEIVMKFGAHEAKFTGQSFLLNFSLPNFYFHATVAYAILRSIGLEIGKRDFIGTPPSM
jgi:uncharacterized protein